MIPNNTIKWKYTSRAFIWHTGRLIILGTDLWTAGTALVRFALMPPYENNNAQKWWDNFFEASYHGDAGDSEQVQWLYLKPRHSRARIWPINHAKRTSRGRTMALNAEGLNLKQKRPFHRRAQTVYWPYLWGIIIFFNIWKCLHVKLIKLYHSEVSNKKCKYIFS